MPLLGTSQEVAKKDAQAFPLGTPGIAALQGGTRERHMGFICGASNFSNTSGRRRKQEIFAISTGAFFERPRANTVRPYRQI